MTILPLKMTWISSFKIRLGCWTSCVAPFHLFFQLFLWIFLKQASSYTVLLWSSINVLWTFVETSPDFLSTWGWVGNDWILISGWTVPSSQHEQEVLNVTMLSSIFISFLHTSGSNIMFLFSTVAFRMRHNCRTLSREEKQKVTLLINQNTWGCIAFWSSSCESSTVSLLSW